jgi:hypothetical protein
MGPETKILGDDSIHSWEQIEAVAPNPKRYAKTYLDRRHQASRWHRLPVGGLRWSCLFLGITTLSCVGFVARGLALADCASSAHSRSCLAPAWPRGARCLHARAPRARGRERHAAGRGQGRMRHDDGTLHPIHSTTLRHFQEPSLLLARGIPCDWRSRFYRGIQLFKTYPHCHLCYFYSKLY